MNSCVLLSSDQFTRFTMHRFFHLFIFESFKTLETAIAHKFVSKLSQFYLYSQFKKKIFIYILLNCNWQFSEILITVCAIVYAAIELYFTWPIASHRKCVNCSQWEKKRCLYR